MSFENDGEWAGHTSPDLFRVLFEDVIEEAMAVLDPGGRVIAWNSALSRLTGCPAGRAMGRHASWFWAGWGEVKAGRTFRVRWRFEDRPPFPAFVTVSPIPREGETLAGFALIVRPEGFDVAREVDEASRDAVHTPTLAGRLAAEPSWAEDADRINEHLFRAVFEGALDAFLLADDEGRYIEANPAAGEVFGLSPGALIGRTIGEFLAAGLDFQHAWSTFLEVGRSRGSLRLVRPDGTLRDVEFNAVANVLPGRHLAVIRDVTEWKREERARLESERMMRSVLDSLPAHIAVLDESGVILQVNRAWRAFAEDNGASALISEGANYLEIRDSVIGEDFEDVAALTSGIRDVLDGKRPGFTMDHPCDIGGRKLWFTWRVHRFESDGPPRVVVSHLDVTDRRTTEEVLKRYAARLEILRSIDRAILTARFPEEIAGTILEHLARLIPCRSGAIETFDLETGEIRLLASHGGAGRSSRPRTDRLHAAAENSVRDEPRHSFRIPLMHEGKPIGLLHIGSDSPPPQMEDHLELAREVANQFAIAIRQALLYEEIGSAKERLEKMSRRLIRAEEDERRRIARELHDEIGQSLTAVKIHIQAACHVLDDLSRARPRLDEGISLVERTLRQIRSISLDLRPSLLDDFGLVAALRSLVNTQARLGGFATHLRVVADEPEFRLEPELETACFRVAQESLTNIVRYAGARYVEVELRRAERELALSVVDDGAGFEPAIALDRASSGESFGLLGMRERVALLGGHVDFHSSPGRGSKVLVRFPLAPDGPLPSEVPR